MDENILKFRVGIFVVIAMAILAILIALNSEGFTSQYTVYIKPVSAPGVMKGTPIRKNGILIGRVQKVTSEDDHVLIVLGINQDEKIYENETCSIGAESILGDAGIKFLTLPVSERGAPVRANHVMGKVTIALDPMEIVNMLADIQPQIIKTFEVVQEAGASIQLAGEGVNSLTTTINGVLTDENSDVKAMLKDFRLMSQKAQVSLDNFNQMFVSIDNVIGDPELKGRVKETISELYKTFQEVRVTVAATRKAIDAFGEIPGSVTPAIENMEAFTGSLKENLPAILSQVKGSLKNVDKFVENIQGMTEAFGKLGKSEGTIGKLINETELYDSLMKTVREAEVVVSDVRKATSKLEPLMNDIRMAGDSIARDPGVLGVRGALDRRPGKTGYKGNAVGREGGFFR